MKLVKSPKPAAMADVDELLKNCRNCGEPTIPNSPVCRDCNSKPVENYTGNCSECNAGAVFPEIQDVCNRCVKFVDLNRRWLDVKNLDSVYGRSARHCIVTFFINHEPSFLPESVLQEVQNTSVDVWKTNMSSEAGAGYDIGLVNAIYEDILRHANIQPRQPVQRELEPEEEPSQPQASEQPVSQVLTEPPTSTVVVSTMPVSSYLEAVRSNANSDPALEVNVRQVWVPVNQPPRIEPPLAIEEINMIRAALNEPENNNNADVADDGVEQRVGPAQDQPAPEPVGPQPVEPPVVVPPVNPIGGGPGPDGPAEPPVVPPPVPGGPGPVVPPPVPPLPPGGGAPVPPAPPAVAPVVPAPAPHVRFDRNSYVRPVGFRAPVVGVFPRGCLSTNPVPGFSDWVRQTHDYTSGEKPGLSLTNWFIDVVNDLVTDVDPEFYNMLPTDNSAFWCYRPLGCVRGPAGDIRPSNLRSITPNVVTPTLTEIQILVGYGQHSSQNSRTTIRSITSHNVIVCNEGIDALWNHDRLVDTDSSNHVSILQSLQQSTAMNKININANVMRCTREFKFILIMQQIQGGSFRNIAKVGRVSAN